MAALAAYTAKDYQKEDDVNAVALHSPILFWKNVVILKGNIFTTLHDILIASVDKNTY